MRRTKRRARRARRTRGGGLMQMLFGGVVKADDPKAFSLWKKCLDSHPGSPHLGQICGENVGHMWQPALIKPGGPVRLFYHALTNKPKAEPTSD